MARSSFVPAARWRRGLVATERIGRRLKRWEERARALREGATAEPPRRGPGRSS